MQMLLFRVLGRRVALLYGSICFLSVAVLSALYMTAGYSLETYVSSQMARIPWDVTILQKGALSSYTELRQSYKTQAPVARSEVIGIMRLQRGSHVAGIDVDGEPLPVRWIVLIASTASSLLPPALSNVNTLVRTSHENAQDPSESELYVSAALLTANSTTAAAGASKIRAGSKIRIYPTGKTNLGGHRHGTSHDHTASDPIISGESVTETFFSATVIDAPTQLKRAELNKWMLSTLGSISFFPENSLLISIPMSMYDQVAPNIDKLFLDLDDTYVGLAAPPYLPELTHFIDLDNGQFFSSWDLVSSIRTLSSELSDLSILAHDFTSTAYVGSDAYRVLRRMAAISELVGLVSLLVAIPLLWLVWIVSTSLGSIFLMNERRLIGLVLIRGVPLNAIKVSLFGSLIIGCIVGGILGLGAGIGIPVVLNSVAGHPLPPWSNIVEGLLYFGVFLGVGLAISLSSGRGMVKRISQMTSREAVAQIVPRDSGVDDDRTSALYIVGVYVAFILGSYKVCAWIAGRSLLYPLLDENVSDSIVQTAMVGESLLNFVAVPLFLYGVIGILRWHPATIRSILNIISIPLAGKFHWFVTKHMAIGWQRFTDTIFITSLAVTLALLPQVATDTFYDRVLRGIDVSLGGDIQLEYDLTELANGKGGPAPVAVYDELVRGKLLGLKDILAGREGVTSIAEIQEYVIPGFYLPSQSALSLNLLRSPENYLKTVYYEENLGLTRNFSQVVQSGSERYLTSSKGFLKARKVPLESDVIFGYASGYRPLVAQLKDVVTFLPGQPSVSVSQREGYATAESEYLNYVMSFDARVFSSIDDFTKSSLADIGVIPSRVVLLIRVTEDWGKDNDIGDLVNSLPIEPQVIRWKRSEQEKVGEDMFISLALGNMNVFMIGGLVLAVAGVIAASLASFHAERRTFSLLRLRGMPLSILLKISLSIFLLPVIVGTVLGVLLGTISGYGISQAIWELPRIYGVAGVLSNQITFTPAAWVIVASFGVLLACVAVGFGTWPLRRTAREAIQER